MSYLGPVVWGSGSLANRLCHDMNADTPGVARTGFLGSYTTSQFVTNSPEITADR